MDKDTKDYLELTKISLTAIFIYKHNIVNHGRTTSSVNYL